MVKAQSNLDIELENDLGNSDYLNKIKKSIAFCVNHFKPDFVLYDAGIDIHELDELGKLNIDDNGCERLNSIELFEEFINPCRNSNRWRIF